MKHHKGKDLKRKQVWVFGLAERIANSEKRSAEKCYMQHVPNREATTLLQICFDKLEPGTLIYSD